MKKVCFLLLVSVSLLMASCDKPNDYVEPQQPTKQQAQMLPQGVQELMETGVTNVQAPPFHAQVRYTCDTYEYNTVYFYQTGTYVGPLTTTRDIECTFKVWNIGTYNNMDPELMMTLPSRTVIIPKGVSSYVLFEKLFQNTMDGYVYHNYVIIESIRYV